MRRKTASRLTCLLLIFLLLTGCGAPPAAPPVSTPAAGETLAVHFIDVGQADAALLLCGEHAMLIDGGNVEDSSLVVSYLSGRGVEHLDYLVCTHAHEDHVGGLSGPLNTCTVGEVLAPVSEYDSKAFGDFLKYTQAQGLTPRRPDPDETFALGSAVVTVLGPRKDYEETNDTSLVLRVDFGETAFLFTGDMERTAEADLLEAGCDLEAAVLKVGHHGSASSTSYPFLRAVMPQWAVISVGTDNSYGHPSPEVLSRLSDAGAAVCRTDQLGSIVAVSDGTAITVTAERSGPPEPAGEEPDPSRPPETQQPQICYIGNRNSKVFHLETCPNLPAEHNRVPLESREAAIAAGYRPCGNCMP